MSNNLLNKTATLKIIKRLYAKPTVKTPDELFERVCVIGAKAIFTDGFIAVITSPENLQVDSSLFINYEDINDDKAKSSYKNLSEFNPDFLDHFILIDRNKLVEKFKEAKNHKHFKDNPYNPFRFMENPILTQLGAGHMRYNTALLIDAAKLFKGKRCYFAMTGDGNYAVVTDKDRTAYAIVAPSLSHPFAEIDDIPSVKKEDIWEV